MPSNWLAAIPNWPWTSLAARADVAVFGAGEPSAAEAAAYWADVDTARRRIARQAQLAAAGAAVLRARIAADTADRWWRWR